MEGGTCPRGSPDVARTSEDLFRILADPGDTAGTQGTQERLADVDATIQGGLARLLVKSLGQVLLVDESLVSAAALVHSGGQRLRSPFFSSPVFCKILSTVRREQSTS